MPPHLDPVALSISYNFSSAEREQQLLIVGDHGSRSCCEEPRKVCQQQGMAPSGSSPLPRNDEHCPSRVSLLAAWCRQQQQNEGADHCTRCADAKEAEETCIIIIAAAPLGYNSLSSSTASSQDTAVAIAGKMQQKGFCSASDDHNASIPNAAWSTAGVAELENQKDQDAGSQTRCGARRG